MILDPLADAEVQAISTSQEHVISYCRTEPVHSHPHPDSCPLPGGLNIQTRCWEEILMETVAARLVTLRGGKVGF